MILNDWPGRSRAESARQWPTLRDVASRAAGIDAIDGLIVIGSLAEGNPDEVSDIDVLAVVAPGQLEQAWAMRHLLAGEPLVTWASHPNVELERWFNWLTRGMVKVECGFVDARSGGRGLVEPFVVLVGDPSIAERFPRISQVELEERRRKQRDAQRVPDNDSELTYGELIDWKLSELKGAVRRGLRSDGR